MSNFSEENLKDSLNENNDALIEEEKEVAKEVVIEELETTNELPVIDLSLEDTNPYLESEMEKDPMPKENDEENNSYSSENYYDLPSNDSPKVDDDENLNKPLNLSKGIQNENENLKEPLDLSEKIQRDFSYDINSQNSSFNNYNNQYSNPQNMNYNNPYNGGLNNNSYTNYNNNSYNNYQQMQTRISRAPIVLGILSGISSFLSFLGSLIGLVFIIVTNSTTAVDPETLFEDTYTRTMLLSIIPVWVFVSIVGVVVIVFAIISTRYIKVATLGFLICTILFFILMFPGYGGSFISLLFSLIATIVSYRNMRKFANR